MQAIGLGLLQELLEDVLLGPLANIERQEHVPVIIPALLHSLDYSEVAQHLAQKSGEEEERAEPTTAMDNHFRDHLLQGIL